MFIITHATRTSVDLSGMAYPWTLMQEPTIGKYQPKDRSQSSDTQLTLHAKSAQTARSHPVLWALSSQSTNCSQTSESPQGPSIFAGSPATSSGLGWSPDRNTLLLLAGLGFSACACVALLPFPLTLLPGCIPGWCVCNAVSPPQPPKTFRRKLSWESVKILTYKALFKSWFNTELESRKLEGI